MEGGPVAAFVLVGEHGEVGGVAALADFVVCYCFKDCTPWFVGMGAVVETAVPGVFEYLPEIVADVFLLHVEGAESLDSWGVDDEGGGRNCRFGNCGRGEG